MCDHHHLRASTPAGEIEHVNFLSENIGVLFMNEDYSDIILCVEGQRFHAHKVILAARSEYFRALLFGGLRESKQECAEVELKETNATAFHHLLKYIYTGKINLVDLKEDVLLEVLGLAHRYGFVELESSISDYLKAVLNIRNVCLIFDIASMYNLKSLCKTCCEFMDRNASDIIQSENFFSLSSAALQEVISRDSFCAQEIEIFRAVQQWSEKNPEEEDILDIVRQVRLPLMDLDELLNIVRESGMISADAILDAIKTKNQNRNMELNYRGFLTPEENVATLRHGAQVIRGEMKTSLLDGDSQNYDLDRGFTRHPIDENNGQGICVKLANACIVNTMKILLWDKDSRSYSFYIEVSMDDHDYVRVIDHTRFLCRSWQYLRFPARVVKYIRIVGTHNTVNRVFHLVSFECLYSNAPFQLDGGILEPEKNVATIDARACVIEGVSRSRNALINGDTKNYDWDSGYTCHQLGSGAIVVQLAQPYVIGSMRLLLWDCDGRSYSYYVEVSTNQQHWTVVADKTKEACRSWQILTFEKRPITFIKIVGTHNTANEVFHCVHFECPANPVALSDFKSKKATPAECGGGANKSQNPMVLPPSHQQLQNHQLLGVGAMVVQPPLGAEGGYAPPPAHASHDGEPPQGLGNAIVHGPHLGPGAGMLPGNQQHDVMVYAYGDAASVRAGVAPVAAGAHGRGAMALPPPGRGSPVLAARGACSSGSSSGSRRGFHSPGRGVSPSSSGRGDSPNPARGSPHDYSAPPPPSPGRGHSP